TTGLKSDYGDRGGMPVGRMGWEPAIATNLSYVGVRGTHPLKDDLNFIWQLEAGIDISATPGTKQSTSNISDIVNGALFSRNSFLGFAGNTWGAAMIGKSETPYKDIDRSPESVSRGCSAITGSCSAIPEATIASNSVCAQLTRSGTNPLVGAASRS